MRKTKNLILGSVVFLFSNAFAFESPVEGLTGGPPRTKFSYQGVFYPWDTSQWQQLSANLPVYKTETQALSVTAQETTFKVPETLYLNRAADLEVPKALRSQQFGLGYSHSLEGDKSLSVRATFGSASDKTFESKEVNTVSLSLSYVFPSEDNPADKWIWFVFYSNNNPVFRDFPLPGFAYLQKRPDLLAVYGVPFVFVKWFPTGKSWNASLLAFGGTVWKTELALGAPFGGPSAFTGLEWTQQTWLRESRDETREKLFYDQKQIHVGYRQPLAKWFSLHAQVGYAFQRRFFEGRSYWDFASEEAVLPDNGFLSLQAKIDL
ncbi:MAG: hypothetical protein ACK5P7_01055 [Bdellovibrio sp.]|jgi:hypothetical protein